MKEPRGTCEQLMRWDNKLACSKWVDKMPMSLYRPALETSRKTRAKDGEKNYIVAVRLSVIKYYNEKMGRVGLVDRLLLSTVREVEQTGCTLRTVLHMLYLACLNGWLNYKAYKKKICKKNKNQRNRQHHAVFGGV